jgi:hypothetical protein
MKILLGLLLLGSVQAQAQFNPLQIRPVYQYQAPVYNPNNGGYIPQGQWVPQQQPVYVPQQQPHTGYCMPNAMNGFSCVGN